MEYRPYYLAREWVKSGHQVTIVAASYSHLRLGQPSIDGDVAEEHIDDIRYVWLRTRSYRGNGVRRVWNMATFVRQLRRHEAEVLGTFRPDVVVASSPHPFVIFPARRIARRHDARLVFEVRDLWPLTLIELGGMSARHPFIRLLQWTEDYAYRHADRVVSVLPKADGYMQAHGMAPEKFAYVPNGICVEEWRSVQAPLPEEHAAALGKLKQEGRFVVGYVGQHGLSNSLDSFVAAGPLLAETKAALVLVGQGPQKQQLQAKAAQLGAANVLFLPPVPKQAVPTVLAAMDALFLGWNRQPMYRYGISPNKLMDYLMAAKPVIHAVEAGNDPVAESGAGISCTPEDPVAIAAAVRELAKRTEEQRQVLGQRGFQYVVENHDYAKLARRYMEVIA
jgi:glycosyltransferase involved in cell wall biosynthesis